MLKKLAAGLAGLATAAVCTLAFAGNVTGAGATFPKPIYLKWADTYKTTGNQVNYQGVGSGAGIKAIEGSTVDFGASDKPLTPDELNANGLMQFPTVIGGVVPIFNLPGIPTGQLRLTGGIISDIYRGVIVSWDDPHLAALNPGLKLPHEKITVVHRADGSGTTFIFTSFLSGQGPAWKAQVGASDSVNWPVGVGGKGNDGVAAAVAATVGSIGYVEYWYTVQNHLSYAILKNKAGKWVQPTAPAFAAAAAGAKWNTAPGFYLLLLDQPGATSWPISGATFILMHKSQTNAATARDVLAFFDWAYKNGDSEAASLDFVPLPAGVKALIRTAWSQQIKGPDGKPVYP